MKQLTSRLAPGLVLAAVLAVGATGCDGGVAPEAEQAPPRVALEIDGRTLFDFRFVDDQVVPCHLGVEHEACAGDVAAPHETVQLGLGHEGAAPPRQQQDPSADQSDSPFDFASEFGEGGSGPSYTTGIGVSPQFATQVRIAAATSLVFAGAPAFFADPGVSAAQSLNVGGSCSAIQELCALSVELATLSPEGGAVSYGQCVNEANLAASQSPEFSQLVNSAFYCRVVAFLRCVVPSLTAAGNLAAGGHDDDAFGAAFAGIFQCAHHLGGMTAFGGGEPQQ